MSMPFKILLSVLIVVLILANYPAAIDNVNTTINNWRAVSQQTVYQR